MDQLPLFGDVPEKWQREEEEDLSLRVRSFSSAKRITCYFCIYDMIDEKQKFERRIAKHLVTKDGHEWLACQEHARQIKDGQLVPRQRG